MNDQNNNNQDNNQKRNNQKNKVDITKYKDLEGVTLNKLKFGLWFVAHRRHFRMLLIIFLIVISAIFWTYSIYGFAYYLSRGMEEDNKLLRELAQINAVSKDFIERLKPKDLRTFPVKMIKLPGGKFDFAVKIKNVNNRHWGEIEYYFLAGDEEVGKASGFIFPGEEKYLLALGQELKLRPMNAQFKIKKLNWYRINAREIPDWVEFSDNRLKDIIVSDVKFLPSYKSGLSEKISLNHLEFNVFNHTAYNYWSIDFNILLFRGSNIISVNRYKLKEVLSDQDRQVGISWPGPLGLIDKVEVIPEVNIMADDIYIKYEGGEMDKF